MAEQSPFGNKDKGRTDSFSLARKASPLSPLIDTRTPRPPSRSTTANPPWVNGWRSSSTLSSRRRLDGTKVGIWRAGSVAEVPGTDVTPSSHGGDHDHLAAIVVVVLVEQELVVGDGDGRRRAARRRVGDRSRPTTWMRNWTITSTSDRTGTVKRWQTQVQREAMLVVRMACKLTEGRVQKVFFLTIGRASNPSIVSSRYGVWFHMRPKDMARRVVVVPVLVVPVVYVPDSCALWRRFHRSESRRRPPKLAPTPLQTRRPAVYTHRTCRGRTLSLIRPPHRGR